MKRLRREIVKRLRFNAEQAVQLEQYLEVNELRFTDLIHHLIMRELHSSLPSVVKQHNEVTYERLITTDLKPQKKRSSKNMTRRPTPNADPKLLMEIGRIGNNINQIARSLNLICLKRTKEIEKLSFVDCLEILANIQSELHQLFPIIPQYFVSDQLAERRKAKAIARVQQEDR